MRFHYVPLFPEVLERAGCSLLVSTYQAGQLVAIGVAEGELTFSFRRFDRAMGIARGPHELTLGGHAQISSLREHVDIAASIAPAGRYDACWLPHRSVVSGGIQVHEVAWGTDRAGEPELWLVNTAFSCLAGLDPRYHFVPRWRPPFISRRAAKDRCHLSGLAMRHGTPAFVTVLARADEPGGWRTAPVDSGACSTSSGEAVTTGLAMPHSPRWYAGNLYVLNSGLGALERVDLATGQREMIASVPGYARGLALHGGLAFVGLSRIRETATFGRVPTAAATTSRRAASASSSSLQGALWRHLSSPTASKRSSTCRSYRARDAQHSAQGQVHPRRSGCYPTNPIPASEHDRTSRADPAGARRWHGGARRARRTFSALD